MTTVNQGVADGLLVELAREERAVRDKYRARKSAQDTFEVARRRYVAVRDAAANYLGKFPYEDSVKWPSAAEQVFKSLPPNVKGNFRFIDMAVGDALVLLLKAADEPLSVEDALDGLGKGWLATSPRALHAAAINTPGVVKEGDVYRYEAPQDEDGDVEPDDLPF